MIWFLLAILVLGLGLLWLITKLAGRQKKLSPRDLEMIRYKWQEIADLFADGRDKEAIFEADKLLDYVFQKINLRGTTFADRLRSAKKLLHNYQAVWEAHKLRNLFAHELNHTASGHTIKQSLDSFKQAIDKLSRY